MVSSVPGFPQVPPGLRPLTALDWMGQTYKAVNPGSVCACGGIYVSVSDTKRW